MIILSSMIRFATEVSVRAETGKRRAGSVGKKRPTPSAPARVMPVESTDPNSEINRQDIPTQRLHVLDLNLNKIAEHNTSINSTCRLQRINNFDYFYMTDLKNDIAYYQFGRDLEFARIKRSQIPKDVLANLKITNILRVIKMPEKSEFYDMRTRILKGRTNRKVDCLHITDDGTMYCVADGNNRYDFLVLEQVDLSDGKVLATAKLEGPWDKSELTGIIPNEVKQFFICQDKILVLTGTRIGGFIDISNGRK